MTYEHYEELLNDIQVDLRTYGHQICDQKSLCFDVLSVIAECILHYTEQNNDRTFTNQQLQDDDDCKEIIIRSFGKPETNEAPNEYDKFFGQPLVVFAFARILERDGQIYTVLDREELRILAEQPRQAQEFNAVFAQKYFHDSGIGDDLDNFIQDANGDRENAKRLLTSFKVSHNQLIHQNTPRKQTRHPITRELGDWPPKPADACVCCDPPRSTLNARRIFYPTMKCVAHRHRTLGGFMGRLTWDVIEQADLRYGGDKNPQTPGKRRNETRQEWRDRVQNQHNGQQVREREMNLNMTQINRLYQNRSQYDVGNVGNGRTQVHHICPQSPRFGNPLLQAYPENMINLTFNPQHTLAHHDGFGGPPNKQFQAELLICNSFYIEREIDRGRNFYTKEGFVQVLNGTYGGLFNEEDQFDENQTFDDLRRITIDTANHLSDVNLTYDRIAEIEAISHTPII